MQVFEQKSDDFLLFYGNISMSKIFLPSFQSSARLSIFLFLSYYFVVAKWQSGKLPHILLIYRALYFVTFSTLSTLSTLSCVFLLSDQSDGNGQSLLEAYSYEIPSAIV